MTGSTLLCFYSVVTLPLQTHPHVKVPPERKETQTHLEEAQSGVDALKDGNINNLSRAYHL